MLSVQAGGVSEFTGRAGQGSASVIFAVSTTRLVVVSAGGFTTGARTGPVGTIDVIFSRALTLGSFAVEDLALTRDGGANLLTSGATFTQLAPNAVRVGGLGALTAADGTYAFTVLGSGVNDSDGVAGLGMLTERFTIDGTGPSIVSVSDIEPSPRSTSVASLDVTFSEPLAEGSFTIADVALRRGAATVNLAGASIRANDDTSFTIAGLSTATATAGSYTLTIDATGVNDVIGNAGTGATTRTWTMQTQSPAAPSRLAITPDRGISATDARTNTGAVALTGRVAAGVAKVRATDQTTGLPLGEGSVSGTTFTLPIALAPAGAHLLAVEALDAAGNASPAVTLATFIDLAAPTATILPVRPAIRGTAVASVLVSFSEPIQPATFTHSDLTLRRDGVTLPLPPSVRAQAINPSLFSVMGLQRLTDETGVYELSLSTAGTEDLAGNSGTGTATTNWRRRDGTKTPDFREYVGQYAGLVRAEVPAHGTSGLVNLKLSRKGGFTGTVLRGGVRLPLLGAFDADGSFAGRAKGKAGLGITLSLVTEAGADAIVGTVNAVAGEAGFVADRVVHSKTVPTALMGAYTLLLAPDEANALPAFPQGDGIAFLNVAPAGTLRVRGEFADGGKFSQGAAITGADEWPFYVPLDKGKGSAFAQIFFRDRTALSDLDASVSWFRAARTKGTSLRDAFTATLPLIGSRYQRPAADQPVFDFGTPGGAAVLVLERGGVDPALELPFTFSSAGVAAFSDPGDFRPSLKLTPATGGFSGSILVPGELRPTALKGIVFPKQKAGGGYFLRTAGGGLVELQPAP